MQRSRLTFGPARSYRTGRRLRHIWRRGTRFVPLLADGFTKPVQAGHIVEFDQGRSDRGRRADGPAGIEPVALCLRLSAADVSDSRRGATLVVGGPASAGGARGSGFAGD